MKRFILLVIGICMSNALFAQDAESPITYKSLALQMSTQNVNGDASSSTSTSVSSFNGFGSFIDNPASMALSKGSFYSISWLNQSNQQSNEYFGNLYSTDFSNTRFSNIGLLYKVPTEQGSFVVGGGYNLTSSNYNEAFIAAFNQNNSITDLFKQTSSDFNNIAFDAYAIDFRNNTSNDLESIFRVDSRPSGFRGIDQFADISNNKTIGETSLFVSTEIQKDFFVGLSLGLLTGSINFDRSFEEVDENNLYDDGAIPADGSNPATDIYSITLTDKLNNDFYAVTARGGFIYRILPILNIGASIVLPSKMMVSESYFANIDTELDDFTSFLNNNFQSEFDYAVTRPAEYKFGGTLENIGGLSISASAEYIDYSSTKVDFTINTEDFDPSEVALLSQDEEATNAAISRDYAAVINFRSSAAYSLRNGIKVLAGYSYYPDKKRISYEFNQSIYSLGLSIPVTNNISADISGQYSSRNDRSIIYEFENDANQLVTNSIVQKTDRLNVVAGIKIGF